LYIKNDILWYHFFQVLTDKKSGGFPVMSIARKKGKNQQKKDIFTENDSLKRKNAEVSEYMADMLKSGIISDTTFQKISSCADFMRFFARRRSRSWHSEAALYEKT
jgi:hypothetical protein